MFKIKFVVLFISLFVFVNAEDKLNIDIYYESLCPDSLDFIENQFYPTYKEIAPYVNINLIPFGKSMSKNGGAEFVCQHGPKECVGNKIQSCALKALKTQEEQINFVRCFMKTFRKNSEDEHFGNTCLVEGGLEWHAIKTCYDDISGTNLQLEAEEATRSANIKFVPTVIYNGIYNQQAQSDSLLDFRTVACKQLEDINEKACKKPSILRL